MKKLRGGSAGRSFLKPFFLIPEKLTFFKDSAQFYVMSFCLSANHNPEVRLIFPCNYYGRKMLQHLITVEHSLIILQDSATNKSERVSII